MDGGPNNRDRDYYTGGKGDDIFVLNGVRISPHSSSYLASPSSKFIQDFNRLDAETGIRDQDKLDVRGYKDLDISIFAGHTWIYGVPPSFNGNAEEDGEGQLLAILVDFTGTLTIDDFITDYTAATLPTDFL